MAALPRTCVVLAALLLVLLPSLAQAGSLTTYEPPEDRPMEEELAAQAVLSDCLNNVPAWSRLMRARAAGRPDSLPALRRASVAAAPCMAAYGATAADKAVVAGAASGDSSSSGAPGDVRTYVASTSLARTLMLQGVLRLATEKNLGILEYVQGRFSALNSAGCAGAVNATLTYLRSPVVLLNPVGAADKLVNLVVTEPKCANERAELTPLLAIFGSLFCPGSGFCTMPPIDKPTDFEARSGALIAAAVVARLVDRGYKAELAKMGRGFFRLALAASHTTSYATCSSTLTAKLITTATIIPTASPDEVLYSAPVVSAKGITLACDSINVLSGYWAGVWHPHVLVQGVVDMVNALALKLDARDVPTWCGRLHCMTRFYKTSASSGTVADLMNEARCVMDQRACVSTVLPTWMTQEPALDDAHDFSYNPNSFKCPDPFVTPLCTP